MNYVFYDFETSGRSSSWDQIIEVGAILVNDDFQVLADPLNIRCSLKPGLVHKALAQDLVLRSSECLKDPLKLENHHLLK